MTNTFSLLAFSILLGAGQLLFKKVGLGLRGRTMGEGMVQLLFSPTLYIALLLYGAATVLWIWILSRVPLSQAYPFVALGVILVPIASMLVYGERVRPFFWIGAVLIVCGIAITQINDLR